MMTNTADLRTIAVDLNDCPSASQNTSSAFSRLQFKGTNYSELLRKLAGINALSFTCSLICIAFDLIFTLVTIGMGASNQSACPMEPRIPIYLIVFGSVNLVSVCLSIGACVVHHRESDTEMFGFYCVHCSAVLIIVCQLFNFIWMIVGSIWIFGIFRDVQYTFANRSETFCQGTLYQYAVVSLIFQYVLPFVLCCCKNIPFHF